VLSAYLAKELEPITPSTSRGLIFMTVRKDASTQSELAQQSDFGESCHVVCHSCPAFTTLHKSKEERCTHRSLRCAKLIVLRSLWSKIA